MKKICTYVILIALNVICYQQTKAQNKPNLSETFPQGILLNGLHLRSVDYTDPGVGSRKFNFERVWVPQVPVSDANVINENTNPEICTQSTSYVDGNGNPLQTIGRYGVSPTRHVIGISDIKTIVNNQYSYPAYTVPANSGSEKFHFNAFTEQENYYLSLYPNEGRTAYTLESDQLISGKKIKNTFSMGKSRVGQLRSTVKTVEVSSIINLPILELNIGTQQPEFNGYYSVGKIYEEKLVGQHNNEIIKYTDAEGRVIANFKLADVSTGVYQKTYYVYDHLGRNIYTILPKASELLEANSWSITTQILENLCSHTVYDDLGRVSEMFVPSIEGRQQMVYDISGRAVMSQTPKLEDDGKWTFTIYDVMGRVAFSGITSINEPREYWQYILDGTGTMPSSMPTASTLADPNEIYFYLLNEINLIQNGGSYPNSVNNCEINSYNYYDHYNYPEFVGMDFNQGHSTYFYHDATSLANATPFELSPFSTMGATTGTKTRVLKPVGTNTTLNDWKISVVYYDKMGRVIQARDKMIDDVTPYPISYMNTVSTSYDWSGKVLRMIDENSRIGLNGSSQTNMGSNIVTTKFEYEPKTFKLLKISQKPNNQNWMLISQNTYNPITGAIQTKNIGDVETQALTYNIRGQLTGINPYYAEHGIPGPKVTFGESIKYDYGFTENRFDGKIAGIIWKTPSTNRRAYGYSYNQAGYMTNGEFSQLDGIDPAQPSSWDKQLVDLSESNLTYDANGNIKTLLRKGIGQSGPETVDDLAYLYEDNDESNRLGSINDASTFQPIIPKSEQDFQDHNLGSLDFEYDKHGNIIRDKNKQIDLITYNEFNKPIKIEFHNGSTIENIYASSGEKLVEIKNVVGQPSQTKYFNGSYEFVNGEPSTMNQPEGRARLNFNTTTGTYDFVYDFMIKDHLGNVRTTLSAEQIPFKDYFADHEIAYANIENLFFENIDNVRANRLGSTTEKVARLNANDPSKRIGTALLLHVMAGDKFNVNADAHYSLSTTPSNNTVSPNDMLQSIVTTLTGNQTGYNDEGGNTAEVVNNVFTEPNYLQAYTELKNNLTDPSKAKAYINYLVFDENFNIITNQSGAIQVNTANAWHNLSTLNDITITQGGYLSVYISNEDLDNVVEFDKLHITYTKGKLLEENHYYPYGMCLRISQDPTTNPENKKLYQTKEFITDENMNIYDFDARQYDPLLGRFTSIDPLGEFASGYVGMGNNPVMGVDPTGMATNLGGNGVDFDNRVAVFKMKESIANYRKQLLIDAQNNTLNQDYSVQEIQRNLDNAWATEEQYQQDFIARAQEGFNQMERARYKKLYGEDPPPNTSTDDLGSMNDNQEEFLEKQGIEVIGDENENNTDNTTENNADYGPIGPQEDGGGGEGDKDKNANNSNSEIPSYVGPSLILLGQPWLPKRFVTPGASTGTSIASKYIAKAIPLKVTTALGKKVGTKVATSIGTNVVGRALGRFVPYAGWALTANDVYQNREIIFPLTKEYMKQLNLDYLKYSYRKDGSWYMEWHVH